MFFKWDKAKARTNLKKHKVSFEEAQSVFFDKLSFTIPDPEHSIDEERFITLGLSDKQRLLVVVHCDRIDGIRIISARKATKSERQQYEES